MNAIEQILIVEDDSTIRCILEMALKAEGYAHVTSAARGDEGLELARRLRPDLVLLDLMLPASTALPSAAASARCPPSPKHVS